MRHRPKPGARVRWPGRRATAACGRSTPTTTACRCLTARPGRDWPRWPWALSRARWPSRHRARCGSSTVAAPASPCSMAAAARWCAPSPCLRRRRPTASCSTTMGRPMWPWRPRVRCSSFLRRAPSWPPPTWAARRATWPCRPIARSCWSRASSPGLSLAKAALRFRPWSAGCDRAPRCTCSRPHRWACCAPSCCSTATSPTRRCRREVCPTTWPPRRCRPMAARPGCRPSRTTSCAAACAMART